MINREAYIQSKLESVAAPQRCILEALQVLGYKLIPVGPDQDGDPNWVVMHHRPQARAVQVKESNINSRWMLHVTLRDITKVEKHD